MTENNKDVAELMFQTAQKISFLNLETERRSYHNTVDELFDRLKKKAVEENMMFGEIDLVLEPRVGFGEFDYKNFIGQDLKEFLKHIS